MPTLPNVTPADRTAGRYTDAPKVLVPIVATQPALTTANSTPSPNAPNSPDKVTKRPPGSPDEIA